MVCEVLGLISCCRHCWKSIQKNCELFSSIEDEDYSKSRTKIGLSVNITVQKIVTLQQTFKNHKSLQCSKLDIVEWYINPRRTDLSIGNVLTNAEKTFEIFPYEERTLLHINSLLWCSYIAHLGPLHSCSNNSIREQFYILCSRSKVHIQ